MFSPKKCGTGRVPGPANGRREKLSYVKICLCVLHLCVLGGHLGLLLLVQLGNTAVDADHGDQQHHGDDEDDCGDGAGDEDRCV